MSETTHAAIRAPEDPIPSKFAEAYAELQAIAERLKPNTTKVCRTWTRSSPWWRGRRRWPATARSGSPR